MHFCFFRHVLKEFGKVEGVVRTKRKPYIPVVLSSPEVDLIIGKLSYPYGLVVKNSFTDADCA